MMSPRLPDPPEILPDLFLSGREAHAAVVRAIDPGLAIVPDFGLRESIDAIVYEVRYIGHRGVAARRIRVRRTPDGITAREIL